MQQRMTQPQEVREFVLAGAARFTIRSVRTGVRFTYRVRKPKGKEDIHFVQLMTGPDNEQSYTFFGTIFDGRYFKHGNVGKTPVSEAAPGALAFRWFWNQLREADTLHPNLEVWHEGRCGRCGRVLTVPESIASGIGPECLKYREGAKP